MMYQKLAIGWGIFIMVICNIPTRKLVRPELLSHGWDKLAHALLFFILTVLAYYGTVYPHKGKQLMWLVHVCFLSSIILFGGLTELTQQYLFTYRSGDWYDFFADTSGVLMGFLSMYVLTHNVDHAVKNQH